MLDPFLSEALARLDAWLVEVCAREEARARRLAPGGAGGWSAVQAMARPPAAELALDDEPPPALIPEGDHALTRARDGLALSAAETEALLVLLAPHVEPRYRALYGVLQDNLQQPWTTEQLVLSVLGRSPDRRRALLASLAEEGRLVGAGFVTAQPGAQPPLARGLDLAPEVRDALLGLPAPASLAGVSLAQRPAPPAAEDDEARASDEPPVVIVFGHGDGRDEIDALARRAHPTQHVLGEAGDRAAVRAAGLAAWRLGVLAGALPIVDLGGLEQGADAMVGGEIARRAAIHGGRVVLRAREPLAITAPHVEARTPGYAERRRAWQEEAARRGGSLSDESAGRLAANFRFGPGGIARAFAAAAVANAVGARGAGDTPEALPSEDALRSAATRLVRVPIRHAAEVPVSRTFADLVVRDTTRAALDRLVHYAENRDRLAEERGLEARFRLRRGPIALFSGLSGTGKTLAAECVAHALGRPLWVVDLSRLVSKYIGETEKHIAEVLTDAERAGVVLFFDEADALFSSRTEVSTSNDRYANLEVGFLLQRVERHDGLVILATNLRHVIDEAFLRRFQFRVEFPFPEAGERRGIWERMLPKGVPRAGELDLDTIARAHRLSGGDITNAALKAIFLAEREGPPLTQAHLDRAVSMELLELGRLSRREAAAADEPPDRGALIRRFVEAVAELLEAHLRKRFIKEIHLVHGAPTKEALAGRRPAVNVALYRMAVPRAGGLRLGMIVSAWSLKAEEEHELLGAAHEALALGALGEVLGAKAVMRVQESYDFELLHRFWSSHGHPVRASIVVEGEVG
jgi:AAA+ superfamily predicted ATPase